MHGTLRVPLLWAYDRHCQDPSDSFAILVILGELLTPPLRALFPGLQG